MGCLRFYRNLRENTFRLTNVIPERIIFVSRGITTLHNPKLFSVLSSITALIFHPAPTPPPKKKKNFWPSVFTPMCPHFWDRLDRSKWPSNALSLRWKGYVFLPHFPYVYIGSCGGN